MEFSHRCPFLFFFPGLIVPMTLWAFRFLFESKQPPCPLNDTDDFLSVLTDAFCTFRFFFLWTTHCLIRPVCIHVLAPPRASRLCSRSRTAAWTDQRIYVRPFIPFLASVGCGPYASFWKVVGLTQLVITRRCFPPFVPPFLSPGGFFFFPSSDNNPCLLSFPNVH